MLLEKALSGKGLTEKDWKLVIEQIGDDYLVPGFLGSVSKGEKIRDYGTLISLSVEELCKIIAQAANAGLGTDLERESSRPLE